jgi:hypothetical protein
MYLCAVADESLPCVCVRFLRVFYSVSTTPRAASSWRRSGGARRAPRRAQQQRRPTAVSAAAALDDEKKRGDLTGRGRLERPLRFSVTTAGVVRVVCATGVYQCLVTRRSLLHAALLRRTLHLG